MLRTLLIASGSVPALCAKTKLNPVHASIEQTCCHPLKGSPYLPPPQNQPIVASRGIVAAVIGAAHLVLSTCASAASITSGGNPCSLSAVLAITRKASALRHKKTRRACAVRAFRTLSVDSGELAESECIFQYHDLIEISSNSDFVLRPKRRPTHTDDSAIF